MNYLRTGVILNTEHYSACVAFYRDILGLELLFTKIGDDHQLSCFDFGGAYLMVETGGVAKSSGKSIAQNCSKLRFNVRDLEETQVLLQTRGVDAEISHFEWGSTINIHDPDGNRIGFRQESDFLQQLNE